MGALGQSIGMGLLDSMYTPQRTPDLYVDKDGNYVDGQGKPTTPYVPPSFIKRVISPTARDINSLNVQASLAPVEAQRVNTIRNRVGSLNFKKMRDAGVTGEGFQDLPEDVGFMSNPTMSPSGYGQQGTSILNNRSGIQGLQSGTDIQQAQTMLEAAKRMASRQSVVESTSDANAATGLRAATSLTPGLTDNEIARMEGEKARMPQEQGNLTQAQLLTALSQKLQGTELGNEQAVADTTQDMMPVSLDTLRKQFYGQNSAATYTPPVSRLSTIQSANGDRTLGTNPVGLSSMEQSLVNAGQPIPTSTTVMGPEGRAINVPRTLHPSITATSQSGPSTRPTVAQASVGQEQPKTINVADTQAATFRPTVSRVDMSQWADGSITPEEKLARELMFQRLINGDSGEGWMPSKKK